MNDGAFRLPGRLTGNLTPEDKVRMVASIDHDARTPQHVLSLALLRMELLTGEMDDPDADIDRLRQIAKRVQDELVAVTAASRQVVDLQQDIVDSLRVDLDDTRPQVRTMGAYHVLRRAFLNNSRFAADFKFQLKEGRSRLQFVADERWVDRILNNLIANAVRHSQGSKIFLGARRRGGDIVLEVRDNGRGLKPEALARVFEPLCAPSSIPGAGRSAASSGLGLYIVQRFAEMMHGSVMCRSAPGAGTSFEVRLPGPVTVLDDRPKRLDPEIRRAVINKFVAVLDDDPEVLKSTERLFESLGVRIFTGEDPVRWFHGLSDVHRMPDLFLMDFQLKGQDVELTLQMVKRKWSDKKPRIIVVTGHLNNPALVRISKTVPVLRKPLNAARIDLLLGVLSGQTELPEAGFL